MDTPDVRAQRETRKPRVLVADDDRVTREYLAGLLRGNGLEAIAVENARQTLDAIAASKPDLILLDVVMPGMGGLECCRLLKAATAPTFVPIVLITAKTDVESRVEGLRIGADDYVCKPFDSRELLARVHSLLRLKAMHDDVTAAKERLERLATHDELTGLHNYRYLHTRMSEELKRAERHRDPLACAMIDVDHFKQVNDTHGHDTGDAVLVEIARRLRAGIRDIDVLARYGGEEFLMLLPTTQLSGALVVAERVFNSIGSAPMRHNAIELKVTVSVGIALYPSRDVRSKDQLIKAADVALYQAKNEGRNRICVFSSQGYTYSPRSTGKTLQPTSRERATDRAPAARASEPPKSS